MIQPTPHGIPNYASCQRKTFHSALGHFLQTEFPATFGPAVAQLFADHVDALYEQFHPPRSRLTFGQVVWVAVAASHRPAGDNRIEKLPLVPLVLDLVTTQDIDDTMTPNQRLRVRANKIVRLFRQAFEQGGVLSQADVSLLLHVSRDIVGQTIAEHQQQTGEVLPSRGAIHDLGPTVSHKAIICYKRLVEKKETSRVAQETFHSPREVEYYVQCLRRVLLCKQMGLEPEDTACVTRHSLPLVKEYLRLIESFDLKSLPLDAGAQADLPPPTDPITDPMPF
jgi:hypothetical protein